MRIIGLTGGIATGKTTVAKILQEKYLVPVLNVDLVSRTVTVPGSETLAKIVSEFGNEVLNPDGSMNRAFLRQKIIEDEESRNTLQSIVIPAIQEWVASTLKRLESAGEKIVVVENAMMFEKGSHENYQEIIVVACTPETQLTRVMARDNQTEEQAKGMIALQIPVEEKAKLVDYVIRNDGTEDDLIGATINIWEEVISES
jgi:dephospho-CoA kinase